jgi:hypothetical protein
MGVFGDKTETTAAQVEDSAKRIEAARESIKNFGVDVNSTSYDVQLLKKKLDDLSKFNGKVLKLDISNPKDALKLFTQIGDSVGITAVQVAKVALASDATTESIKKAAKAFVDADAAAQARTETTKATVKITDDLTKAIEYQDYLFQNGATSQKENVKEKIDLYQKQIDKLEKVGETTGLADTAAIASARSARDSLQRQLDALDVLAKLNEKLATSGVNLTETTEDRITRFKQEENDKRVASDKFVYDARVKANDDLIANATETDLALIDLDTLTVDQLTALNEKLSQARADSNAKLITDSATASDSILQAFSGLAQALGSLFQASSTAELDALTSRYDLERELIENNGMTKQQALQDALDKANQTGDAQKIADAKRALDLYNLDLDYKKKKADLEYKSAHQVWEFQVAAATASALQAAINATASAMTAGPFALATLPLYLAAAAGAINVAGIVAAEPKAPQFSTGGIVLPSGDSGQMVSVADRGGGELLFGTSALGQPLMQGFADLVASKVSGGGSSSRPIQIVIDGKIVAQSTADWLNSGQVRLETR